MLNYNLPLLQKLLQNLGLLVNTSVSYYDKDFRPTNAYSTNFDNHFCNQLKTKMYDYCVRSDLKHFQKFNEGIDNFFYSCHAGLVEAAFKLYKDDETIGYILIGPFRDAEKQQENLETIKKLSVDQNFDSEQLFNAYLEIPEFHIEKYEALKNVLYALSDYAIVKKIFTINNNFFTSHIVPYIDEHLKDELSIEHLSKQFFLSKKQLYTLFDTAVHKTPKKFINEQRIIKAKNLIVSTDLALPIISETVGINDYNYFIKVFKAYDNHTPMYYRKKKNDFN